MHQPTLKIQFPIIAAATLMMCASTVAQEYQVIDLGAITPGMISSGFAVNDGGQVVGQTAVDELSVQLHAFRWDGRRDHRS